VVTGAQRASSITDQTVRLEHLIDSQIDSQVTSSSAGYCARLAGCRATTM
jgi:tyrosine-protein phosphatase YwqE